MADVVQIFAHGIRQIKIII